MTRQRGQNSKGELMAKSVSIMAPKELRYRKCADHSLLESPEGEIGKTTKDTEQDRPQRTSKPIWAI